MKRGSQARIIIIVIIILKGQYIWHVSFNQQIGSIPFSVIFPQSNFSKRYSSMCSQPSLILFYIIRATWPTISFCASSLTQLSHLQHSASFMSKNHEAKWGKRAKQSYTLTPNIYSCLLLMSNKQHQSLWVIHWVKCTCLCRTCNTVCSATTREFLFSWFSLKLWDICDKQLFILLVPSLLFCPPIQSHRCCSSLLHRSTHLQGLFNTKTTHIPKIALSVSHLLNRDKGSKEKGSRGWKSALINLEDSVSRLPAATPLPMLALQMTVPCQPCTNQTLFSWPHKLPGATVKGKRQTDWLHSLSLGHYTALSDPVCPLIFLLAFSCTLFLMERPLTFIAFLVNNTSALWKVGKWQNGWQVRWGEKKSRCEMRRISYLSRSRCAVKKEWMNWQKTEQVDWAQVNGEDMWRRPKEREEGQEDKAKCFAKYETWVVGWV